MILKTLCVLLLCFHLSFSDVYMHWPRGSNNRLDERSANRNNANRLFDSQVSYDVLQHIIDPNLIRITIEVDTMLEIKKPLEELTVKMTSITW